MDPTRQSTLEAPLQKLRPPATWRQLLTPGRIPLGCASRAVVGGLASIRGLRERGASDPHHADPCRHLDCPIRNVTPSGDRDHMPPAPGRLSRGAKSGQGRSASANRVLDSLRVSASRHPVPLSVARNVQDRALFSPAKASLSAIQAREWRPTRLFAFTTLDPALLAALHTTSLPARHRGRGAAQESEEGEEHHCGQGDEARQHYEGPSC